MVMLAFMEGFEACQPLVALSQCTCSGFFHSVSQEVKSSDLDVLEMFCGVGAASRKQVLCKYLQMDRLFFWGLPTCMYLRPSMRRPVEGDTGPGRWTSKYRKPTMSRSPGGYCRMASKTASEVSRLRPVRSVDMKGPLDANPHWL